MPIYCESLMIMYCKFTNFHMWEAKTKYWMIFYQLHLGWTIWSRQKIFNKPTHHGPSWRNLRTDEKEMTDVFQPEKGYKVVSKVRGLQWITVRALSTNSENMEWQANQNYTQEHINHSFRRSLKGEHLKHWRPDAQNSTKRNRLNKN